VRKGCKELIPLPVASIAKPTVLARGFDIMAAFAERLPVALVPEQITVSSMRRDVINDRGGNRPAVSAALGAQWMLAQEQRSRTAPSGIITTTCR
jgi:hypothetical protein